jgi:hypothetical protein
MNERTRWKAAATGAALAMCLASVTAANADPAPTPRLCTWGGTPDNPTGVVTFDPGITYTPSDVPIATHAVGRLEGPGCTGTMVFDGIGLPGGTCHSVTFEGSVHGLPGVARLFGPGIGPLVHEFLYDRDGNVVGSDQPLVKAFGNNPPDSNVEDCNTPEGFRRGPFSSTVELYG